MSADYPLWLALMEDAREAGQVAYRHPSIVNGYTAHYALPLGTPTAQPFQGRSGDGARVFERVPLASACFCQGALHPECEVPS